MKLLSPTPVAPITYDLAGRRQALSYPNGVTTTYTPNRASFLTNLLTRYNGQTTINSFAYSPDGMSNRANMTDLAGQHVYSYDDTHQLTNATHPNMATEHFSYDEVGNRQSSEGQAPSTGKSTEYVYDFENRLIEVNYSGMAAQYKYDPFGRRIEKSVNGTITRYVYDGPNMISEYDGQGNVAAKYLHTLEIDDPLTMTQGTNTYYYHRDGLGSVVNLTNSNGYIVKTYTYKSFGEINSESGSLVQPFAFTGREYDPESGLYFYRARYYDPRAGRFLTKDPIGFAGGDVNLYRYAQNNPINWIDPSGLSEVGRLPGTNIPYRIDWNQHPEPNMHVKWPDGTESIITSEGGWLRTHGGKKLVATPQKYRDALREISKRFTKKACKMQKGSALKTLGKIGVILSMLDIFDTLNRAAETGKDPAQVYLEDMGFEFAEPEL